MNKKRGEAIWTHFSVLNGTKEIKGMREMRDRQEKDERME